MGLHGVQPLHPPPPNFKDCFKCKGKKAEKKEKNISKLGMRGGGVPTNIFRGLKVLQRT